MYIWVFPTLPFRSETLQELIKLGVNLSKWDRKMGVNAFILPLNFEEDMKPYIV